MDPLDRFLNLAGRQAEAPAIVTSEGTYSFGWLLSRAMSLSSVFATRAQPRVMIAAPKGPDTYAAMIAAGLAGGFYTPVNLTNPPDRLRRIASALQPGIVFAAAETAEIITSASPGAEVVHPGAKLTEAPPPTRPRHPIAYVIFTSGTTGQPKGVTVSRTALEHYVEWLGPALSIRPGDRLSQHPPLGFDLSVLDIYGALCFGAALHVFDGQASRLFPGRKIKRDQLTLWNSVPSVLSLMIQAGEVTHANLSSVQRFHFCGEPLLRSHLDVLFEACPDAVVFNTYGPTEATVSMTVCRLTSETYRSICPVTVPLGEPIHGMGLSLVGGPDQDSGEIIISGPQVALGYWNDAEQTDSAFGRTQGEAGVLHTYRTGDHAIRRNGQLYFAGRKDGMVKVRGNRIELEEVRGAFANIGWTEVFLTLVGDDLCAAVETGTLSFSGELVREGLGRLLDPSAIPHLIVPFAQLPRGESDKISPAQVRAALGASAALSQ